MLVRVVEFVLIFRSSTMFCIVLTMFGVCDMAKQTLAIWIMMKRDFSYPWAKKCDHLFHFKFIDFDPFDLQADISMLRSNFIWLLVFCLSRALSHIPSLGGTEKVAIHTHWLTDDDDNHTAKLCGHQIQPEKENRLVFDWITPFD